jgi:predicted Holliday junction resolvase-like endonuclease
MGEGKELNYWPGFVDALSNVVLTLVFVLVVFVFALVMASNKVGQKVLELAELAKEREAQRVVAEGEMLDLRKELRDALAALQEARSESERLKKQIEELKKNHVPGSEELNALKEKVQIKVDAKPTANDNKEDADVERGTGVIVIVFPRGIFELNDKAKAELVKTLAGQKAQLAGMNAQVRSVMGAETFSEARRLAYYRGLTVRNALIDQGLGTGKSISVNIEQDNEVGDGRVEIRFHRR